MLVLSPCLPPCICGGQNIPVSPNLLTYSMTHKINQLAPLCPSLTTGYLPWPPIPSSQKNSFPTTAHHGTVSSPLPILGCLGNLSFSPSIVQWRGNPELPTSVATHLDPPTFQWPPTESPRRCPPIPPQDLPPRITWTSSMDTSTTSPLPPQTAAQPLTSWPPPQQHSTHKSKPCLPLSIPPPTVPPARAHMPLPPPLTMPH